MESDLLAIVIMLGGMVLGALIVWLAFRGRPKQAYEAAKADTVAQVVALQERLVAKDRELEKLREGCAKEVAELAQARQENALVKADLEGERRAAQERRESFKQAAAELSERFKALSRDALKDNNQSFLELANATLQRFQQKARG